MLQSSAVGAQHNLGFIFTPRLGQRRGESAPLSHNDIDQNGRHSASCSCNHAGGCNGRRILEKMPQTLLDNLWAAGRWVVVKPHTKVSCQPIVRVLRNHMYVIRQHGQVKNFTPGQP